MNPVDFFVLPSGFTEPVPADLATLAASILKPLASQDLKDENPTFTDFVAVASCLMRENAEAEGFHVPLEIHFQAAETLGYLLINSGLIEIKCSDFISLTFKGEMFVSYAT